MTRSRVAVAAALAVAIVIAALAGIFVSGGGGTYEITAYFPRAIGLFPHSTVRVLGVEVGHVTSVVPTGDRVRVRMNVEDGVKIPSDARPTMSRSLRRSSTTRCTNAPRCRAATTSAASAARTESSPSSNPSRPVRL